MKELVAIAKRAKMEIFAIWSVPVNSIKEMHKIIASRTVN
jgi:hypothetical protein